MRFPVTAVVLSSLLTVSVYADDCPNFEGNYLESDSTDETETLSIAQTVRKGVTIYRSVSGESITIYTADGKWHYGNDPVQSMSRAECKSGVLHTAGGMVITHDFRKLKSGEEIEPDAPEAGDEFSEKLHAMTKKAIAKRQLLQIKMGNKMQSQKVGNDIHNTVEVLMVIENVDSGERHEISEKQGNVLKKIDE